MEDVKSMVLDKVHRREAETGKKATHIVLGIDMWYRMRREIDPILGEFVPAEYSKNSTVDSLFGLTISLLTNTSNSKDYMEVL